MPSRSPLAVPRPPWVEVVALAAAERPEDLGHELPGFAVRQVEGRRCGTKAAVLRELARAFAFPAHFGRNWDALEDCLGDLEWLPAPGYLLVVTDADRLLATHEADYRTLVEILETVGAEWARPRSGPTARPALSFHTLLTVPRGRIGRRSEWVAAVRRRRAPGLRGRNAEKS